MEQQQSNTYNHLLTDLLNWLSLTTILLTGATDTEKDPAHYLKCLCYLAGQPALFTVVDENSGFAAPGLRRLCQSQRNFFTPEGYALMTHCVDHQMGVAPFPSAQLAPFYNTVVFPLGDRHGRGGRLFFTPRAPIQEMRIDLVEKHQIYDREHVALVFSPQDTATALDVEPSNQGGSCDFIIDCCTHSQLELQDAELGRSFTGTHALIVLRKREASCVNLTEAQYKQVCELIYPQSDSREPLFYCLTLGGLHRKILQSPTAQ